MKSVCHIWLGSVGLEPGVGGFRGRFFGSGLTWPWRVRIRHTVAGESRTWWWCLQVPADRVRAGVQALLGQLLPQPKHQLDRPRAGSPTVTDAGRRERGSNAASPSAR